MSLFKQISLIMSLFLLLVLTSVMTYNFQSAKTYAQEEMSNSAQNTATYLSLSLATAQGNKSQMSTMINAIFDSGYFQQITLNDTQGELIYQRVKEEEVSEVPTWFRSLYDFNVPVASATVSAGWNPIGVVKVFPVEQNAHLKLYKNFFTLLQGFILFAVITFTLLYFILNLVLRSLKKMQEQAEAVSNNNFIINEEIPSTMEFKEVTLAMNKMVTKVKNIFDREAASVKDYHKLLYIDKLTGLGNRSYFELKLGEFISSQEEDSNGFILTVLLDGISQANKAIGHEKVDSLIKELSTSIHNIIKKHKDVVISKIDGTKISIIFPNKQEEDIENISESILSKSIMLLEKQNIDNYECSIKILVINYGVQDSVISLLDTIEKTFPQVQKNMILHLSTENNDDVLLEKSLIENAIKENAISLALQDVFDTNKDIFHSEAYIRLFDEQKNIYEAGNFIPIVHKMHLDKKLDQNVINYALKEHILQDRNIALNISSRFIQDKQMHQWLKERLAGISDNRVISFEISNHNLLQILNDGYEFSFMVHEAGHVFGIDRFSIENGTNLNYLQMLKPKYLKIDSTYLYDMLKGKAGQTNHALQILIESLDINIIATNIEDEKMKKSLEEIGIKYFQGSLLAKPKLI